MRRRLTVPAIVVAIASCGREKPVPPNEGISGALPPGHVPIVPSVPSQASSLAPATQALIDSGNIAFRQKKFDAALDFYHKASREQPDHAAPWFGTYMVGQATKNQALAESALRVVRERAPETKAHPGAVPPTLSPGAAGTPTPYSPHQRPRAPQGSPS